MTEPEVIDREARLASQIRPFLFVGGVGSLSPRRLHNLGTLVNLVPGLRVETPRHVKVIHIPIEDEDSVDLSPLWTPVFRAIDEEKRRQGKLLLLCAMGISRSATFAIAYLMCVERLSLHDAYKHVQHCRNIVCPNVGFFRQLIELEEKFYGKSTVRIIEPMPGVEVADVVWNELYDDMIAELRQKYRNPFLRILRDGIVAGVTGGF